MNAQLDAKGAKIAEHHDAKGDKKDARLDERGAKIDAHKEKKGDKIDEKHGGSAD
jgi:hypothetical protein